MFSINRPQEAWSDFCTVLGLGDEVKQDPRFDTTRHRAENCAALIEIIDEAIAAKTCEEWLSLCRSNGVICAPVTRVQDVSSDLQMAANGYIVDTEHETIGPIKSVGAPIAYSKASGRMDRGAPELGQHTEEILLERGFTWQQLEELRTLGII